MVIREWKLTVLVYSKWSLSHGDFPDRQVGFVWHNTIRYDLDKNWGSLEFSTQFPIGCKINLKTQTYTSFGPIPIPPTQP
ncbi:hypothetical protein ACTXT7_000175 [Hymenolepis weldensis]